MTIEELKAKVKECRANVESARHALREANCELLRAEFGFKVGETIKSCGDILVYTGIRNREYDSAYIVGHAIKKDGNLHATEREISHWGYNPPVSLGMYDKPIPEEYL